MAVTPGPPPFDPNKKPILQGANDTDPYVGKPKPMPAPRPVYGSSDGSGFDFQKYLAGQHRPRPMQVLPGQGIGPMPVGTKPLPNPQVKDPRNRGPVLFTGDNRLNRGGMGRPIQIGEVPQNIRDLWVNGGSDPFGGMQDMKGGLMDDRGYPGAQLGGTQVQIKPGGMGLGGQDPMYGGAGTGPSYGGPTQARDFNMPNYGAPVDTGGGSDDIYGWVQGQTRGSKPLYEGASPGPPPVGTGPGSMGKPQQPGRQPLRPGMEYRPGGGQRPHGGQMQMPPGVHPDLWNQMDEETRMRLAGMWGGGGMQPMLPNEQGQAPPSGPIQAQPMPRQWDPRMGSGYYGAF